MKLIPLTPVDTGAGNTNSAPEGKTKGQHRGWTFTLWDVDTVDSGNKLSTFLEFHGAQKFSFQIEKAPTTEKLHCQGYVYFKNNRTFNGLRNLLGETNHYEFARGSQLQNQAYTTKSQTFVAGPWTKGFEIAITDILTYDNFYNWQKLLYNKILHTKHNGKVNWIYDKHGQHGKTEFVRTMCHTYKCLLIGGTQNDGLFALSKRLQNGLITNAVLINLPRDSTIDYKLLETITDGIAFSSKYESGQIIWQKTWVWVFSNSEPNHQALSKGRIHLYTYEQIANALIWPEPEII